MAQPEGKGEPKAGGPEEVVPDIFQIQLPIPRPWSGRINCYLLRAKAGWALVDCGWGTTESFDALAASLQYLGLTAADISLIVVTHIHPDHYGQACRIKAASGAPLVLHRAERDYLENRYGSPERLYTELPAWFRRNGAPEEMIESLQRGSRGMLAKVSVCPPDREVSGGEHIQWGRYDLEVIWTPGHSIGHFCLYDRGVGMLISGDHLLGAISSNISAQQDGEEGLLSDYLDSLRHVSSLPINLVLPGHGRPFRNVNERVRDLLAHHEIRLEEVYRHLPAGRESTAHEVALRVGWQDGRGWNALASNHRRLALMETIAHLDLLCQRGLAESVRDQDRITYARTGWRETASHASTAGVERR